MRSWASSQVCRTRSDLPCRKISSAASHWNCNGYRAGCMAWVFNTACPRLLTAPFTARWCCTSMARLCDTHLRHLWRFKMTIAQTRSGFVPSGNAQIYYEIAGAGQPLIMIHAGVADSRQWNDAFAYFAQRMRVVRYDLRGYGKSVPVDGEWSHMADLIALLAHLELHQPLVIMGC